MAHLGRFTTALSIVTGAHRVDTSGRPDLVVRAATVEGIIRSTRTVDMHVRNILTRLGCRSRVEVIRKAAQLDLLGANTAP